ncbi:MAG: type II toxin-antitoxin system HicA family toxin [Scytonema sp. RU_4_4]|nr:type II toxin-antitoxin system HicA family toxin [Scytonema sp. RU_4_4]NJR74767.1 type II toxin-antitoxin system HicA family toxin [Scytonema sp. CRU_2_7]
MPYTQIITALERYGWVIVRQRGSHIRLEKTMPNEVLKLTVPAYRPVKRTTLAKILKQARIDLEQFLELL